MNIYKKKYVNPSENHAFIKQKVSFVDEKKSKSLGKISRPNSTMRLKKAQTKGVTLPNIYHRVLSKMCFGGTPALISYIQSLPGLSEEDKINAYIDEQLVPTAISDTVVEEKLTHGYQTLNKSRIQLFQQHSRRPDGQDITWSYHILPGKETTFACFLRASQSNRQLLEMMADFWHNHFNVYMDGDGIQPMFVHYDRDVIRANALGNFRIMLEEVTKSTCMLDYLGNAFNHKDAPNENFAREILELHTISAKNYLGHMNPNDVPVDSQGRKIGYVEADVVEMARALTGWSYSGAEWEANATGEFLYRDDWHDKASKTIMGNVYNFDSSQPLKDIQDILDSLAEHPATAEFLAIKLCTRFISDNPPQSIIEQVKESLHQNWQANDQIKLAMEVLLKSSEFQNTWAEKVKRPFEKAVYAMRQLGYTYDFDPTNEYSDYHFWSFYNSGQNPFYWTSPNGYPDKKSAWLGASSTMATWRFMQWISALREGNLENSPTFNNVLSQTLAQFPNANDRTANNLVDYWFERICGLPPDANTQDKLAKFMSFSDTSVNNWAPTNRDASIDLTSNDWPDYNQDRLFAMISTIFTTAEFNYR